MELPLFEEPSVEPPNDDYEWMLPLPDVVTDRNYVFSLGNGRLKIGYTGRQVAVRAGDGRTWVPDLQVVMDFAGDTETEKMIHAALSRFRIGAPDKQGKDVFEADPAVLFALRMCCLARKGQIYRAMEPFRDSLKRRRWDLEEHTRERKRDDERAQHWTQVIDCYRDAIVASPDRDRILDAVRALAADRGLLR
jgi:hypothetical protein